MYIMKVEDIIKIAEERRGDKVRLIKENEHVYIAVPFTQFVGRVPLLFIKSTGDVRLMNTSKEDLELIRGSKIIWELQ